MKCNKLTTKKSRKAKSTQFLSALKYQVSLRILPNLDDDTGTQNSVSDYQQIAKWLEQDGIDLINRWIN